MATSAYTTTPNRSASRISTISADTNVVSRDDIVQRDHRQLIVASGLHSMAALLLGCVKNRFQCPLDARLLLPRKQRNAIA
jgi:hypothetical protein